MKVAAAVLKREDFLDCKSNVIKILDICNMNDVNLVVFPALTGVACDFGKDFISWVKEMSAKYNKIAINPGSFFEKENDNLYHSSFLILNGNFLIFQRQLYLSRWEKDLGFSRGKDLDIIEWAGFKMAIILSTDVFYPQVFRYAALKGVNLVLSPVAIKGRRNFARQIAGVWENVQQNLFFAVESGFKGEYKENNFYSEAAIHAPLEMTKDDTGFLAKEDETNIIFSDLDESKRQEAVFKFDVLKQLNINSYKEIFR